MPYKPKLKSEASKSRSKSKYKVVNWTEYNKSLKKRGELSFYFPKGDLKALFINDNPYVPGMSGQQATYSDAYIELIFTFYRMLNMGMRQTAGYFEDFWRTNNIDIAVPSFGHLSDLFGKVPVKIKLYCEKIVDRVNKGESITLILDSTGMRFGKASHWYEEKYGKPCDNRPWRKLHLGIDPNMNMHSAAVTDYSASDISMVNDLLNIEAPVEKVISDGAYYSINGVQNLSDKGITPVIPPPSNAVVHGDEATEWHDKIVKYIQEKETVYAFYKKYGYGLRALVDAQIARIKRCIGTSFKTQKIESQENEGTIIANLINQWNAFGKCKSVKIS